ncbi:hypothetical protein [Streptomyces sp. NPDC056982]|uniref:hypothetical protein n=1 Tax=Streptomyces sp. NPDC056982 TaxID=3345986 RepID=UPI003644CF17
MAITMENWVLTWTDTEGKPRRSVVSYNRSSAEDRKERLLAEGCTDVVVSLEPSRLRGRGA